MMYALSNLWFLKGMCKEHMILCCFGTVKTHELLIKFTYAKMFYFLHAGCFYMGALELSDVRYTIYIYRSIVIKNSISSYDIEIL